MQAIKSSCRKNAPFALYKGDAADAALLYKNVACNDTLLASRYSCNRWATSRRLRKSGADSSKGLGFKARPHPKVHLGMDKMVQKRVPKQEILGMTCTDNRTKTVVTPEPGCIIARG